MANPVKIIAEITEEAKRNFFGGWGKENPKGEVVKEEEGMYLIVFPDGDIRLLNAECIKEFKQVPIG